MSKKIVAMLMAVAMAFSLLPVTAFATDGTQEGNSQTVTKSDKNLTMNKTVTPKGDGTYTVSLESYATGEVKNTTTTKSSDIVLLLDVSGSMSDLYATQETYSLYIGYENWQLKYYSETHWGLWYKLEDNTYVSVSVNKKGYLDPTKDKYTYSYTKDGEKVIIEESIGRNTQPEAQFYYKTDTVTKIDALKEAVNAFIDDVAEKSPTSQISIVKFAGKETNSIGNDTYNGKNYTQIVEELTKVDDGGATQLKKAVSKLTAAGATSSDYGLKKAEKALENATKDKVVVLFTDGEPNHNNGFDYKVATAAVNTAKILKDNKTTIYTVGVFKDPSERINQYMSSVSSNHPGATATVASNGKNWTVNDGGSEAGTHYINAENATDLIKAFQTISSQVSSTHLDASAVVVDNVPSNFALTENSVKVYTANCIAKNGEKFTWGEATQVQDITPNLTKNADGSQTISTTGFDFSKNWCGLDKNEQARGRKLIIEFTIECTNYGGTQPTNAGAYIKAKEADEEPIISLLENPEVPVTISLGSNEELLEKLKVEEEQTYNGSGFAILSEVAEKANDLVDGINNAYVNMELTVTVEGTTYTYKIHAGETTGSWYQGDSEEPMDSGAIGKVKTSKDVRRSTSNEVEVYTYNFDLTLSDATPGGAESKKYQNNNASFKIKPASVTVTADDKQVTRGTVPESIAYTDTVTGLVNNEAESLISRTIKCEGYTVDTPVTAVGSELEITASGAKEQGNYTVTYRPGKLTVVAAPVTTGTLKVTKEVQGENLTLKSLPSNFRITVTGPNSYNRSFPLPETVGDSDKTVTWTISDLPAGEYTVSETGEKLENYTCEAKYHAGTASDATVTVNNTAQNQPATVAQASQKVTVTAGVERTMTVTNTYTKNATVKLSDLIKKELTVKDSSALPDNTTFTVTVTPKTANGATVADPQPIPGTVSDLGTGNTNGDGDTTYTASFNFGADGTLSLPAGTYTYTVQENANSPISGMKYDSNTYTLTIEVKDSSYTATCTTGEGSTAIEVSKEKPLTIQNTYQTPDLTVTKQPYKVNDTLFDADKTVAHVNDQIIWKVNVTNNKTTQAFTQLKDTLGDVKVYKDAALSQEVTLTGDTWTATVPAEYYVTYTVKPEDISNGKIVNAIVKDGDEEHPIPSAPVSTWDTKQLKSAKNLNTSDWTTTVKLTLPTVNGNKEGTSETEVQPNQTIAISKGSKVEDTIGKKFTLVGIGDSALENGSFTLTVGGKEITGTVINGHTVNFGEQNSDGIYPYTVDYAATSNKFDWNINEDVYAGTEVTLSYKLKLTNPQTAAGTYGVTDLDGNGFVDGAETTKVVADDALYTNEKAALYIKENDQEKEIAVFPKPSVSYTIKSSSGSHSGGSRPSLNTKDHYGYIIGYPVDYYTGQPTTDQTKKPVRPEGKITRAEVATIYFRMLTDESRTKFWSQNSGYSDVKTGDWFNNAVSTLSNAGIIAGYEDGSFRPNGYITRAEFATIAARFFDVTYNGKDLFPDISGHWAKDYINQAANKGFVNGYEDGTFKPDRNITRAEAVTLVNRTLDRHPDKNHFTKDMLVWPDNMDQTKWYYADMQEATNSHTYQMKENSDKTKYENWTKTLPIRNWEALEKAWSNANSSQGNGNVV